MVMLESKVAYCKKVSVSRKTSRCSAKKRKGKKSVCVTSKL